MDRWLGRVFLTLMALASNATAGTIVLVDPETILANRLEDFESFPQGSYDEVITSPGVSFGEHLTGQQVSVEGDFDVVTGVPDHPLSLGLGAPGLNLAITPVDGDQVVAGIGPGFAIGEGAIALLFEEEQVEIGLFLRGTDGGSATLDFFRRDGTLIDSMVLRSLADERLAFRQASGVSSIAAVVVTNTDPGGLAVDDVRFGTKVHCLDSAPLDCTFTDRFDDGLVDGEIFTAIDADLSESDGRLRVDVLGETGGVSIENPLPRFAPLSPESPNQAWFYRIDIDPPFADSSTGLLEIVSLGPDGEALDRTSYDPSQGTILLTERDPFGNLLVIDDGPFLGAQALRREKKRKYQWFPPVCSGPRCSYGLGPEPSGGVVIVARWKIGKLSSAIEGPPIAPVLGGIQVTSTEPFAIREIELKAAEDFPGDVEATWQISQETLREAGGETVFILGEELESLGVLGVEVGGVAARDFEIISDDTLRFTTPAGSIGPTEIRLLTADASVEVTFESVRYYAGDEPLVLEAESLPEAMIGVAFSAPIGWGGGKGPYTFSLASGELPDGLTLSREGLLSGVPGAAGVFSFFIAVSDGLGNEDVGLFFLQVDDGSSIFSDGFESGDTAAWTSTSPFVR